MVLTIASQQQPILICGMHRSGTSLIAQMLFDCGLYLGEEFTLMKAHTEDNPTGYWEYNEIVKFSEGLITKLQGSWSNPNPFQNPSWLQNINLKEEQQLAVNILSPIMKPSRIWGWKDPRITIILPFWKTLFSRFKLVICLRNPLEVAFSLSKRLNGHVDYAQGLRLWQDYHEILLRDCTGLDYIVVHYQTMLCEPKKELNRLCHFVNLAPSNENLKRSIMRIKTNLYRSIASVELLKSSEKLPPRLLEIYQNFSEIAGNALKNDKEYSTNNENQCNIILERVLETSTTTFDQNFRSINWLKKDNLEKNNTITKLNVKLNEYEQTINRLLMIQGELKDEILSRALSNSWRFTRPFRKLRNLLKGQ